MQLNIVKISVGISRQFRNLGHLFKTVLEPKLVVDAELLTVVGHGNIAGMMFAMVVRVHPMGDIPSLEMLATSGRHQRHQILETKHGVWFSLVGWYTLTPAMPTTMFAVSSKP